MKYDELVNELDKVGVFRYAHEKAKGCEMVQCSIFKILAVVNLVEQATLERAAKVCDDAKLEILDYHEELIKSTGANVRENLAYSIRALKDSND